MPICDFEESHVLMVFSYSPFKQSRGEPWVGQDVVWVNPCTTWLHMPNVLNYAKDKKKKKKLGKREYLLARFASAGSICSAVSVSPSISSSAECSSLDDPLVAGMFWIPELFCIMGKAGMPIGPPTAFSCVLGKL